MTFDPLKRCPVAAAVVVAASAAWFTASEASAQLAPPTARAPIGISVAAPANSGHQLVPASYSTQQDSKGYTWDLNSYGNIKYGTNYCFSSANYLYVSNSQFSPSQAYMKPDRSEYILSNSMSGVMVIRRIKIDRQAGLVRWVESFHNPTPTPRAITIKLHTSLRYPAKALVTNTGNTAAGVLGKQDCGLLAVRHPVSIAAARTVSLSSNTGASAPSVLFYLADKDGRLKPSIQNSSNQQFYFYYNITVPPQKTVSIVHGLAQRNLSGTLSNQQIDKLFDPFRAASFTKDLPKELRRSLLNASAGFYSESPEAGPLLKSVIDLADRYDVEREAADVLILDEETQMTGRVKTKSFAIDTRFGKTEVQAADVAALEGGAGVGRTMRLHLRNGEILVGAVTTQQISIEGEGGLGAKLTPEQINVLLFRRAAADGKPPADALALMRTHSGDRLAVSPGSDLVLEAVGAWGPIHVPLAEIRQLRVRRQPQPIHRLVLNNGTQLDVMLGGGDATLRVARFGEISLPPTTIARLTHISGWAAGGAESKRPEQAAGRSYCVLIGENRVVGDLTGQLEFVADAGSIAVDAEKVFQLERSNDDDGVFHVQLADGRELSAVLKNSLVQVKVGSQIWRVPAAHLQECKQPRNDPKPAAKPPAGDESPAGGSGESGQSPPDEPKPVDPADDDPFGPRPGAAPSPSPGAPTAPGSPPGVSIPRRR